MTTPMIRLSYAVTALMVSCLVVAGVSVQYANYVDRKSNQRWCQMLSMIDDGYKERPPKNDQARRFADTIHQLRTDFGCAGFDPKEGS